MKVLDLFSGIGGFSLGIEATGIKIKKHYFSDIDKYANKLYERRFPNATKLGSITNVSYKKLKGEKIDLLTGGFPCQAFSIAGKRRGFEDTRGTLFFEITRILKDYIENGKPIPCILLENVKGLLSHDNRRTFTKVYELLTKLNYTIECQVVNTRWFLPQNRERIFIFGRYNRKKCGRKIFPIKGKNTRIEEIFIDESRYRMENKLRKYNGYSPTLNTSQGGGLHPLIRVGTKLRRLTPVECERLQGFPDNWTDGQSDTQRYKQLGNAVSVPVIKAIVEKIYDM